MRKGFKSMAMLLCACMMLEMACRTAFAKQPEVTSEASLSVEEAAPEVTVESEASADAAGKEAAEEQNAPAEETETGAEAEDGSTEPENDTKQEAAPEEETDLEKEDISETKGVTEKENAQETEAASESEDASESEEALETDAAGTLETEDTEDPEDSSMQEGVPEKETLGAESAPAAREVPEKETAAEAEESVFECESDGVSVTARTKAESGIPEDAELHAEKLEEGSETYRDAYTKVSKGLDLEEGDKLYFVPFDVYFTDSKGGRIEPESGLTEVTMTFESDPFAGSDAEDEEVASDGAAISADAEEAETEEFAVHILDDGTVEQLDADISDGEVVFEVGSFSVMGFGKVVRRAGIAVIADKYDYYIVPDNFENPTRLTFCSEKPDGKEVGRDCWGEGSDTDVHEKLFDLGGEGGIKTDGVTSVELQGDITLNGKSLLYENFAKLRKVTITGKVHLAPNIASNMFSKCPELTEIDGLENLDLSEVTIMNFMFEGSSVLTSLDLSNWDTTGVTSAMRMFMDCHSLRELTVGDKFKLPDSSSSYQIHDPEAVDGGKWITEESPKEPFDDSDLIKRLISNKEEVTYYWAHKLTYDSNGGTGATVEDDKWYPYDKYATLKDGSGLKKTGAAFVGWSKSPEVKDRLLTSEDDETDLDIKKPGYSWQVKDENIKLYAVWGEDKNSDGIADYREVEITFDINSGNGSKDEKHNGSYTETAERGEFIDLPSFSQLKWTKEWNKEGDVPAEHPAVFAGWTEEKGITDIILEDDLTVAKLTDKMIRLPHIKVPDEDTTYYAMYAADENNDQIPDYFEHAEQVEYYANGGTMIDGNWLDGIVGLFYRCGHHHVAGEDVTLLTVDRGKGMIERAGAVLLGWSGKGTNLLISEQEEKDAGITTTYMMPKEENGKVYAVWASDINGNQIPDYEENKPDTPNGGGKPTPPEPAPEPPAPPEVPDRNLSDLASPEEDLSSDTSDYILEQSTVEGWLRDAAGWRYRYADGTVAAGRWEWIKDKWYYFNADGYMATGWKQLGGVWYYLDEVNGDMKTGWQLVKGVWYHLDDVSGAMDTGWYLDPSSGKWYYLNGSGAMQIGWQLVSGTYYYLNESAKDGRPYGSMYANEATPDGYAVDASGAWIQ